MGGGDMGYLHRGNNYGESDDDSSPVRDLSQDVSRFMAENEELKSELRSHKAALEGLQEERDQLYKLLAALVWDQEKHVMHISRSAWNAMDNVGQYELVKADAPHGTVRLTAKHNPVRKV